MTPPRNVLQNWVADHPVGESIDPWSASRRGSRQFRRWLVLRTVTAIVVGAAFVAGMVGLRPVVADLVSTPVTASLVVSPGSGLVPLKVTADGSGSTVGRGATVDSYVFDFGDGDTTGPQPKAIVAHTYQEAGRYTVTLTVTDSAGRTGQFGQDVTVTERTAADPTARLRVHPTSGPAPLKITARGSTSSAGADAEIDTYAFDFGDGDTAGPQDRATANHTYEKPGRFTVRLTVTNSDGRSDRTSQEVTVTEPPAVNPTARLRVRPSSGPAPLGITATGVSSEAGQGEIETYAFDFGDGSTTGPQQKTSVPHTYKVPGPYTVTLTVTDSTGRTGETSQDVTVTEPVPSGPTAELQVVVGESDPDGFLPLVVNANGSGSQPGPGAAIKSYTFDFGDRTIVGPQLEKTARHIYQGPGTYTVRLTVADDNGVSDVVEEEDIKVG